jgi:hypothetical protein
MNYSISEADVPVEELRKALLDSLLQFNEKRAGVSGYQPLTLPISDDSGATIGGLLGQTAYGWLFTHLLFIPEALRSQGIGTELMLRAESEAVSRGCHSAWLDTFEFQALAFYERLGYERFGELENYPEGFRRYFMRKKLSSEQGPRRHR